MEALKKALVLIFIILSLSLKAEFVLVERAKATASNFLYEHLLNHDGDVRIADYGFYLVKAAYNDNFSRPLLYVFGLPETGFIIVSADDKAFPVLAYSFDNEFVSDNMAPALKQWLEQYKQYVYNAIHEDAGSNYKAIWDYYGKRTNITASMSKLKSVAPLLTTTWNQDIYYNAMCPEDIDGPGGRVYAGCVATAMAQVMKYYNYPPLGQGSHGYYHWQYGLQFADFGNTTYNWNAMTNNLNGHNHEIARLLYHCGVAVEMGYSPQGSGAWSEDVVTAAKTYFGYSPSTHIKNKDDYTNLQWKNMLIANLDALMPLYYSGYSDDGGHAFNCDGYNQTPNGTYFHFNWGWGGYGNGFFFLDFMNSPGGTFNYWHQAVFDMYPGNNYPAYCLGDKVLTATAGTFEDGSGHFNYLPNANCSWLIDPALNVVNIKLTFSRFETEALSDIVRVYDGDNISAPLLGEFSGTSVPPVIESTGKKMLVVFTSDANMAMQGWKASYTTTRPVYCPNVTVLNLPDGAFSDGSDAYLYNTNTSCRWRIEPQDAAKITLGFTHFDIDASNATLEVFDVSASPYTLLDVYTGNQLPPAKTYNASKLLVWFKSGNENGEGWSAFYASEALGSSSFDSDKHIVIYPSPFIQRLNIKLGQDNALKHIDVINSNQQIVHTAETHDDNITLPLEDLQAGVFIVRIIYNDSRVVYKKVVKL